jgi:hypothetical protein
MEKKAIWAMPLIGIAGRGKPVCREPLDAEWLSIVRDLLGEDRCCGAVGKADHAQV